MNDNDMFPGSDRALAALKGMVIALSIYLLLRLAKIEFGVYAIFFIFAVWLVVFFLSSRGSGAGGELPKIKLNIGKLLKTLIYLAILAVVLYFASSYLMNTVKIEQSKGPLNEVIYVERQDGAGLVVNNGTYGIQLATGSAKTGTTFIVKTKEAVTGWPAFASDVYSPKGNSTLKVSYIDLDVPSRSIRFKKISIPADYGFRYSNKYKLKNYRAWIKRGMEETITDNSNMERENPMRHNMELEIYVAPNSYVELSNMVLFRNW